MLPLDICNPQKMPSPIFWSIIPKRKPFSQGNFPLQGIYDTIADY